MDTFTPGAKFQTSFMINENAESNDPTVADDPDLRGLLFESSPYGNVDAVVQHDAHTVYFYLNGEEAFGTRACWVRNLTAAPYVIDQQKLQQGVPPLMPRTHCRSPEGLPIPVAESLKIVWFEEGTGAALFEDNELIAVIPPWSGIDGFHGYSLQCTAESQIAWPLPDHEQLQLRINNAYEFWQSCSSEATHPYATLQPQILSAYEQQLGQQQQYFSIDGGQFPPRGAAAYRYADQTVFVTVGMSMRPQPGVELAVEHPREQRRIELALAIPTDQPLDQLQEILQQFSGLVAWPWDGFTWFGEGHTCELGSLAKVVPSQNTTLHFTTQAPAGMPAIQFEDFRGDPVTLLWLG